MQKQRTQRTLGWWASAVMLCLSGAGCGARSEDTTFDSQSHWLTCRAENECGELSCECGLCTAECTTDEDCWNGLEIAASRCQAVESFGCEGGSAASRICVPDCADERCVSDEQASETETETTVGAAPPELVSVPECPELTSTASVAANFRTDLTEYAGPATVEASGASTIRLVPDAVAGEVVELSTYPTELSQILTDGQRFDVEIDVKSGGDDYKSIVVRGDGGELVLVIYQGYDVWYQAGRFRDATNFGGTLELRMTCQSNIGDACFESQVQSSYAGVFSADTTVTVEGDYEDVSIGGNAYGVYVWAAGVFGGDPMPDCSDVQPGRSMAFVLYKKPGT